MATMPTGQYYKHYTRGQNCPLSNREETMKALSVRPEWAMPILQGLKTVECRSWKTDHRGDLLICSSSRKESGTISGHALCVVNLLSIERFTNKHIKAACMEGLEIPANNYAWLFDDVYFIKPFEVKGKLHLFDIDDSLIEYQTAEDNTREWLETYYKPLIHYSKKYEKEDRAFIESWLSAYN